MKIDAVQMEHWKCRGRFKLWLSTVACNLLKSWLACDCRRVVRHVSKSYNLFRVVCHRLGVVVRLIYTKQSLPYGWREQVACASRKSKLCCLNRPWEIFNWAFQSTQVRPLFREAGLVPSVNLQTSQSSGRAIFWGGAFTARKWTRNSRTKILKCVPTK